MHLQGGEYCCLIYFKFVNNTLCRWSKIRSFLFLFFNLISMMGNAGNRKYCDVGVKEKFQLFFFVQFNEFFFVGFNFLLNR